MARPIAISTTPQIRSSTDTPILMIHIRACMARCSVGNDGKPIEGCVHTQTMANRRDGSKADMESSILDSRFAPESGHSD